jgi:hypothetical protein
MSNEFRNNHYVPEWYQKRFLPQGQKNNELLYRDLKPEIFKGSRGISRVGREVRRLGFRHCFSERDLYSRTLGSDISTEIEREFFGQIDSNGKRGVEHFGNFSHHSASSEAFQRLILYMSTQKLRTPKGLRWLSEHGRSPNREVTLQLMQKYRQLYCALWTECVWLIADASKSNTKFLLSDHPVTVYNRRCGPSSQWCRGCNDPDISLNGTHTIFPLSLEKLLILTNLSWVRNPYQSEVAKRPNSNKFRDALFKLEDIQINRGLSEDEVRQINFIIKSRSWRYIAAANEEWLYPERYVTKSDWNRYGSGYLFMPDPRSVTYGGTIFFGFADGTSSAIDEYGRRPWEPGFDGGRSEKKDSLHRFQGEFARLFGPYRRGRAFTFGKLDNERDDDACHQYHLNCEKRK